MLLSTLLKFWMMHKSEFYSFMQDYIPLLWQAFTAFRVWFLCIQAMETGSPTVSTYNFILEASNKILTVLGEISTSAHNSEGLISLWLYKENKLWD
jgi:hypothetical protein